MPIFGDFDIAQLVLYSFWAFFFALVVYLQRETMREGYPLESEFTGKPEMSGLFGDLPSPKTFKLPFGRGEVSYPNPEKDALEITDRQFAMKATAPWSGAPFEPTGNPLVDGIGPAAWAERRDEIELTLEGEAKIVPLRAAHGWSVAQGDRDLTGRTAMGCDGKPAGTVKDIWVDRSEQLIRYVEIETAAGRSVLVPWFGVVVSVDGKTIKIHSIRADQFDDIPGLKNPEQITKLEEEKVMAYVAGGKLYASADRLEPLL